MKALHRLFASLAPAPAPTRTEPTLAPKRAAGITTIDPGAMAWSRHGKPKSDINPFAPALHPPVATPDKTMAMDEAPGTSAWALNQFQAAWGSAIDVHWPGWTALALLSQRPEFRNIVGTLAREMTREWIKISASGDGDKTDKVNALEAEFVRLKVREHVRRALEHDGFYGRGQIFLDFGDSDQPEELITDIGDGTAENAASKLKVSPKRPLKALRTVEAMWTYPIGYGTTNPLAPDWYRPQAWFVQGKKVHASRLLTLISRELPDLLKPAYSFGGLSMTQIAQPYVDNWLRTRQSVADAIEWFSTSGIKTNLGASLQNMGMMQARAEFFIGTRNNRGLMMLDKDTEEFFQFNMPLGTLDHLQAQSQEQMASIAGIPLVKLLGVTPSGLNASSEGEIACFDDTIAAAQEAHVRSVLDVIFHMAQRSLWGEVDPDISYAFEPLRQMTQKELAEIRKIEAETDQVLVDLGAISNQEVRVRVAEDPTTPYPGLDADEMPGLLGEEDDGLAVPVERGEAGPDRDLDEEPHDRDDAGGLAGRRAA